MIKVNSSVSPDSSRISERLRSDGASEVAQATDAKTKTKSKPVAGSDGEHAEKVSISSKAKEAVHAKAIAKSTPDVDEEKVARLKAAIQSGSYKVDADKVADKMVDEHLSLPF